MYKSTRVDIIEITDELILIYLYCIYIYIYIYIYRILYIEECFHLISLLSLLCNNA